ncbi:hypothetical protein EBR37_02800 [bacterium]|nr:hypothetical protein [bacterium]
MESIRLAGCQGLGAHRNVIAPEMDYNFLPNLNPFDDLDFISEHKFKKWFGLRFQEQVIMEQPNFKVLEQKFERHVVIPDLHGENMLLERVIEKYQREDTGFVFLGDLIDRKGDISETNSVPKLLDTIIGLGNRAIITLANHELILLGALNADDPIRAYAYGYYYDMIKAHTVSDYDIRDDKFGWNKDELKQKMTELGHLALLMGATPYYETETFIATHAGINHKKPWEIQKERLDNLAIQLEKGDYPDPYPKNGIQIEAELEPIFSMKNATDTSEIISTDKIIVSGHAHTLHGSKVMGLEVGRNPLKYRKILNGQRIRLASQLNRPKNDDLFIWQDWDQEIVVIPNRR